MPPKVPLILSLVPLILSLVPLILSLSKDASACVTEGQPL